MYTACITRYKNLINANTLDVGVIQIKTITYVKSMRKYSDNILNTKVKMIKVQRQF